MYLKIIFSYVFLLFFLHTSHSITETIETPIEISNPIFTTKGINEMPYTIKASSGIQKGDNIELYHIEGKIKNRDNIWIYLNAEKGNYNQISQVVFLYQNIEVYTDNEEILLSDEAIVDIQQDKITLISNVKYENKISTIEADKSVISNDFQNFDYSGSVKTSISNF